MDSESLPDALRQLKKEIEDNLSIEQKFQPFIKLSESDATNEDDEVTVGIRNGVAHILRCLKVWYDLPSEVLLVSVNIMDRFLSKMKVRAKHMACISIASFQLACKIVCSDSLPDPSDLVIISQCKCTTGDLARMENMISTKLGINMDIIPVTAITFLKIFRKFLLLADIDHEYTSRAITNDLWQRLEMLACDASCSNYRACEFAFVLLCSFLNPSSSSISPPQFIIILLSQLKFQCRINNVTACHTIITKVLAQYNAESQLPHKQRLTWKLSSRTMRQLRPSSNHVKTLPTIEENVQLLLSPTKKLRRC